MSVAKTILLENIHGEKMLVEDKPLQVLTESEVKALNMKITPELLKKFGDNDAQKFFDMLENGQISEGIS